MRVIAMGLAFAGALVVAACGSDPGTPGAGANVAAIVDSADQVAFGSRTLLTDNGLLRAEVFADTALFMENNTRASLRVVHADFFGATGAKEATLTAQVGNLTQRNGTFEAWGNVIITSVDGRVLKTPMIRFLQNQNQISSDSSFVLTEPGEKEMRGVGFRADPNLSAVQVLRVQEGRGGVVRLPNE